MSVCPVDCGKMADWIWMLFGVLGWLGPRMRHIDRGGDAPWEAAILGVNVGHPIVTSGDFVA